MFERNVQYDYIGYVDQLIAQQVNCWMLMLYDDVCTADRKLDIGYVDSCRTAGPEVMLAHK